MLRRRHSFFIHLGRLPSHLSWFTSVISPDHYSGPSTSLFLASQNEVLESRQIARCDIQMGLDFSMSRAQEVVPFPRICHPIMLTFPKRETRPPPLHTRKCVEPLNTILLFLKNIISCFPPEKCFLSIPYLGK